MRRDSTWVGSCHNTRSLKAEAFHGINEIERQLRVRRWPLRAWSVTGSGSFGLLSVCSHGVFSLCSPPRGCFTRWLEFHIKTSDRLRKSLLFLPKVPDISASRLRADLLGPSDLDVGERLGSHSPAPLRAEAAVHQRCANNVGIVPLYRVYYGGNLGNVLIGILATLP